MEQSQTEEQSLQEIDTILSSARIKDRFEIVCGSGPKQFTCAVVVTFSAGGNPGKTEKILFENQVTAKSVADGIWYCQTGGLTMLITSAKRVEQG